MSDPKKLWAVEWNHKDKMTQVQFLSETIEGNLRFIRDGAGTPHWLLVGVTETPEQANKIAGQIEAEFC